MRWKLLLASVVAAVSFNTPMRAQELVKGLVSSTSFAAASEAVLPFQSHGKSFKAMSLWHNNGAVIAVEGPGGCVIAYEGGKPRGMSSSAPRIGFSGASESRANRYQVGIHDFTNDGNPDLVIAVSDGADGLGVYVLTWDGSGWKPIGEMVTAGKGVGGCRVFRQALTMKAPDGVLYSWTCHGSQFDFLSSDHKDDPRDLY